MSNPPPSVRNKDIDNLNVLAVFHYVVGGLGCLASCVPVFHLVIGIVLVTDPEKLMQHQEAFPEWAGYFFIGVALFAILVGWIFSLCIIFSGRAIAKRERWTFSFVMAVILCMFFPFGTVLGVFTLVLLNKDPVKTLYGR